jgi:hypothetical protein
MFQDVMNSGVLQGAGWRPAAKEQLTVRAGWTAHSQILDQNVTGLLGEWQLENLPALGLSNV